MGQTAGGGYTRTAMEKKMCLINGFVFRLFTVKAVSWKAIAFTGKNWETALKKVSSSSAYQHVKEHRLEKSLIPTALIVAMSGENS